MKTSIKALVAAVALAGVAGGAHAGIQKGDLASAAAGSELVFYAFDDQTKTSYVKDLDSNLTFSTFAAGPTFSYSFAGSNNISSDSNWTEFLGSVNNNTSNVKWGVFATLKTSALAANGVQILTTARNNTTANTTTSLVRGIDGSFNTTYLTALADASAVSLDNSYFRSAPGSSGNWAVSMQHSLAGKVSFLADNAIGTNADFYKLSAAAAATTNASITTLFSGDTQWAFDGNSLYITTAAVPEPGTWAMLIAGLMMVGGIARRRIS